jgi:hypothetical protein
MPARHITNLPKAEHEAAEWEAAMEALILVARGGPTMLARIGVMRASNRHYVREFDARALWSIGCDVSSKSLFKVIWR